MSEEEKQIALAVPGEWALKKVFGPALTEIGEDLKKVYAKGRDKLISAAYRKVRDRNDGKQANLRVTRDVLWNGAFTEDEVCAEYFVGILASSGSEDGRDDAAIQFVDAVKSLSAKQLRLHYVIYNSLNKLLVAAGQRINVGKGSEIQSKEVWFAAIELIDGLQLRTGTDLNILHRHGLLYPYSTNNHELSNKAVFPYSMVHPNTFGILLYAAAHNRLNEWRTFDQEDFGDFPEIALPNNYAPTLQELLKQVDAEGGEGTV